MVYSTEPQSGEGSPLNGVRQGAEAAHAKDCARTGEGVYELSYHGVAPGNVTFFKNASAPPRQEAEGWRAIPLSSTEFFLNSNSLKLN